MVISLVPDRPTYQLLCMLPCELAITDHNFCDPEG